MTSNLHYDLLIERRCRLKGVGHSGTFLDLIQSYEIHGERVPAPMEVCREMIKPCRKGRALISRFCVSNAGAEDVETGHYRFKELKRRCSGE